MDWLNQYAQYTKDHFSPGSFHLWVGISCISTVLERKVWTRLFADKIYPHQYIILVAPPGICGKGAAISMGTRLIYQLPDLSFGPDMVTKEKLIRIMSEAQNTYQLNGRPTIHSSVTMVADELEVFMTAKNEELIVFLTKIWSAEHLNKFDYKTKHVGDDIIIGPWLNILGATTPEFFSTPIMNRAVGGGFSARTVFLYSEWPRKKNIGREAIKEMETHIEPLVVDLEKIHELKGEFHMTPDAWAWFQPWVEDAPQQLISNKALAVFKIRAATHILKLAMVFSAAEGGNDMHITKLNLKEAHNRLNEVEKGMERLFMGVGKAATAEDCKTILIHLDRIGRSLSLDELREDLCWDVGPDELNVSLNILVRSKKVLQTQENDGTLSYEKVKK